MLQARDYDTGDNGVNNVAIVLDRLHEHWAVMTMKLACASERQNKHLEFYFDPGEVLAKILEQGHDLNSLTIYGEQANT